MAKQKNEGFDIHKINLNKIKIQKDDEDIIVLTKRDIEEGNITADLLCNNSRVQNFMFPREIPKYLTQILNNKYTRSLKIKNHKYVIVAFEQEFYEKYILLVYAGYEPSVIFSMLGYPGRLFKATNLTGDMAGLFVEYFNNPPNKMWEDIRANVIKHMEQ